MDCRAGKISWLGKKEWKRISGYEQISARREILLHPLRVVTSVWGKSKTPTFKLKELPLLKRDSNFQVQTMSN